MGDLASSSERVTLLPLDITSPESISALREEVHVKCGGKLHFIFHNAGYRSLAMGIEAPYDESVRMMTTNLAGVIELNRMFADMVIAAKGVMVFTSSLSGLMPQPTHAVYCASKAALDLWARILRIEMHPLGVRVVVVHTGGVKTTMADMSLELDEGKSPSFARSGHITCLRLGYLGSRYRYLLPQINEAWSKLESGYMEPDAFARTVVDKLTRKGIGGWASDIWAGTGSFLARSVEVLNLNWLYDSVFARMFGFNTLKPGV